MDRVGNILEREGEVLETLLFKLVETRLILEADEYRFLARATREVERARTRAREVGLLRAATVANIRPGATLRSLASTAPSPWPGILRDHHQVLCGLLSEIEVVAHQNAVAARAGIEAVTLDRTPVNAGGGFDHGSGHGDGGGQRPVRTAELDRLARGAAFNSVLGTAARLHMPDLVDFLR